MTEDHAEYKVDRNDVDFITDIFVLAGYAKQKSISGYIYTNHTPFSVVVSPFFEDKAEPVRSYDSRVQLDVLEDWLHENHHPLTIKAALKYPSSDFKSGHEKRRKRIKYCLDELMLEAGK